MRNVEADLLSVISGFQAAALGDATWLEALEGLAGATGSRTGQLIGLGSAAAVPFNWMTEMPPDSSDEFLAAGGGAPRVNRRVGIGSSLPELRVVADGDFAAYGRPDDPPEMRQWFERHDVPHICLAPLLKRGGLLVGLAVLRSRREGHISVDERRVFTRLAPHLRAAVRTQMLLAEQGASVLAGALEAMSIAAFVCDARGTVLARTPLTEPLLEAGTHFSLRGGRLTARNEADGRALATEIFAAGLGDPARPAGPTVLRDQFAGDPVLVEVAALPADRHPFTVGRPVLVLVRPPRPASAHVARLAAALFDLTPSEAAVVADLVAGLGPQAIADRRGSAVTTVRTHVRRIFEKASVTSQLELVAAINRRL